jgi:hypothetical protein
VKRRATARDLLPLSRVKTGAAALPTGEAFQPQWIDFERGIRVGNLEPHERITQILKYHLEQAYATPFITDRWGRGVYWQWICWLPRANREAKPISHGVNFGCAKLFISLSRARKVFLCGLQVERGFLRDEEAGGWVLADDWDWHRLMKGCAKGSELDAELRRLILREGFEAAVEGAGPSGRFARGTFASAAQLRSAARRCPADGWAGFQLYYPMPAPEVRASTGYELVKGIVAAFTEVVGVMNLCMQAPLRPVGQSRRIK